MVPPSLARWTCTQLLSFSRSTRPSTPSCTRWRPYWRGGNKPEKSDGVTPWWSRYRTMCPHGVKTSSRSFFTQCAGGSFTSQNILVVVCSWCGGHPSHWVLHLNEWMMNEWMNELNWILGVNPLNNDSVSILPFIFFSFLIERSIDSLFLPWLTSCLSFLYQIPPFWVVSVREPATHAWRRPSRSLQDL